MKDKIYTFYTLSSMDEPKRVRYVGVTSNTLEKRFQSHKGSARGKRRSQPVHQWMYSKYKNGFDIICKQIDQCFEDEWQEKEKYWIAYYRKIEPELLNLQNGGSGIITKEMRSIDGMERTRLASIRPVAAYDDEGNLIAKYESLTDAAKKLNISKGNISAALSGKKKHCRGYKWKYLEKKEINFNKYKKKVNPDYNKRLIVYKFNKNNKLVKTYQSARQVIRDIFGENCTASGDYFVKNIINKSILWHKYYWSTSRDFIINDNHYTCKEVDKNGNIIKLYRTFKSAAKEHNISIDKLKYRINKHRVLENGNFIEKY